MDGDQVHFEFYARRRHGASWTLELACEDRTRALESAEEMLAEGRAVSVKVTKETLDDETLEFQTVTILKKGDPEKGKAKPVRDDLEPLCVSPQDLYTGHARERITRLLDGWLARNRVTAFELLHRPDLIEKLEATGMELQHAVQKVAIPEAQARGKTVHEIIRTFQQLVQSAIDRVLKDGRKSVFANFEAESFAHAAERLVGDPERHYRLGGGVAAAIGAGQAGATRSICCSTWPTPRPRRRPRAPWPSRCLSRPWPRRWDRGRRWPNCSATTSTWAACWRP